ncbi:MAG TPA: TPM domain-containing protein [Chthoniobacterales bacterium]|nr:TPM domain-containing protein [Chthoniobacterales bacterium]
MKLAALCFAFSALALTALSAAEVIPPAPLHYFNDYAGLISQSAADQFDRQLVQFDRGTSNQVVVAIFPKMQSDNDVPAYTQRVFDSWRVGQKDKRNGVVLFVFVEDRKMYIQVGYGLEGALPDVSAFNITEHQIKPKFIAGDYEGGLRIGIDAICQAIAGEYKASTRTVEETPRHHRNAVPLLLLLLFIPLSLLFGLHRTARQGVGISSKGTHWAIDWGDVLFFWLNLLLSSSSRSSSGSSSSGGGFSGGGGSSGGGGAGSSW